MRAVVRPGVYGRMTQLAKVTEGRFNLAMTVVLGRDIDSVRDTLPIPDRVLNNSWHLGDVGAWRFSLATMVVLGHDPDLLHIPRWQGQSGQETLAGGAAVSLVIDRVWVYHWQ